MKKIVTASTFKITSVALVSLVLSSCVPSVGNQTRGRLSSNSVSGSSNVALYQGRVLADNPIILSRNSNLAASADLNKLLSTVTITTNSFLTGSFLTPSTSCAGLTYCFEVRATKESPSALQTSNGKWAFNATTPEFLQVNTFYHLNSITDLFFSNLTNSYNLDHLLSYGVYDTSIPSNALTKALITQPLITYANCNEPDNAYFERTTQTLCLGYISEHTNVKWAQDSSAIYHEAGHFFQKMQLNLRNDTSTVLGPKVDMGNFSYDEAGSIGEGLSDFYSYFVNGRTHFSEWGAGRFLNASRPMSERDPMHVAGVTADADQRLSYPQFLNYNPNSPTIPVEDIHYSGMIISHYLVALTEDLQDKCVMTRRDASDLVMHLITETLAEHGDLTSLGTEGGASGKINLNSSHSSDWFKIVNPITYRSFMQTFAKNLKNNLSYSSLNRCNGSTYTKDQIESLIDQYGLLLFRTYNENRNLAGSNTNVNAVNRQKSVLVSKNMLILDPTVNASSAYIIDNRDQIKDAVASLQAGGLIESLSAQTPSNFGFNNGNGKMSPGEVVAVALNLYNNSNSTIGGVQILANDWNHASVDGTTGKISPCRFPTTMSNDQWPLLTEGGVACVDAAIAPVANDFTPVCFMQSNDATATKWISQKDFQTKMALDSSMCLDPTKPNECFVRAIKGADQAHYSKINAKSTWGQTMANPTTGTAPTLSNGNVLLFEVSKHIPPATIIDCRLRVRFTNCEDCYHDTRDASRLNYDFTDLDYNGPRPYKVIHLEIPIID
jgi:hypothetical protein